MTKGNDTTARFKDTQISVANEAKRMVEMDNVNAFRSAHSLQEFTRIHSVIWCNFCFFSMNTTRSRSKKNSRSTHRLYIRHW